MSQRQGPPAAAPAGTPPLSQRRYLLLLYVTLFQVMIGFGLVIPILPYMIKDMGAGSLELGLMVTVWAAGQFLFAPSWGSLSDRIGRRPVVLAGLSAYVLTFGLMALAKDVWTLIAIRALGGVLSAATIPAAQAYVADVTAGQERGQQMARMGAAMNMGFLLGPSLGGLLAPLGYQAAFAIAGLLALVNAAATYFLLPEPPARQAASGRRGATLWAVGAALRGPQALLYLLAFAATFGGSTMFSTLGFYLMERHGAPEWVTAAAFTVEGTASALFQGLAVGPVTLYLGEGPTVRWSLIAGTLGFFGLILAPDAWFAMAAMVLVSLATSFLRPTIAGLLSRQTTLEQGVTMGIQSAFDALGRMVAPSLAGAAFRLAYWAPYATAISVYLGFYAWSGAVLRRAAAVSSAD